MRSDGAPGNSRAESWLERWWDLFQMFYNRSPRPDEGRTEDDHDVGGGDGGGSGGRDDAGEL